VLLTHAVGVDGCRSGWCAVSIRDDAPDLTASPPSIYPSFQDVLATDAEVICIDVPIGLLDGPGQRPCDVEARKRLGRPRASSVFPPPCRSVLKIEEYRAASEANFEVNGKKLPKQSFAIMPKITRVDSLITPDLQTRIHEVHPEVCFWALNSRRPMSHKKSRLSGRVERWQVLCRVLPSLPEKPPRPRDLPTGCAVDDYIDSLVAAWTAVSIARGSAQRIPSQPEIDDKGLRMEMWFPAI